MGIVYISTPVDFNTLGNGNDYFETGETIELIQNINVNACEPDFDLKHEIRIRCGQNVCLYPAEHKTKLLVITGRPLLRLRQKEQQFTNPCQDGEAILHLSNFSSSGSFDLGKAAYDIRLNIGWSIIQGGRRTEPRRDNCLRFKSAWVDGTMIPIITGGFSGYGLDFRSLASDPDGPGGLDDLDGDGFYDDLRSGDTIRLRFVYALDASCLNYSCSGRVFASRLMRMEADYRDYCDTDFDFSNYISSHNYQWERPGIGWGGFDGLYVDEENDTLTLNLNRSTGQFLSSCAKDSAVIRITLPRTVELPNGAIITVNGDTVNYTYNGSIVLIRTDSFRFRIRIPLKFHCDPNSGSGGVNTPCTFCIGTGGPMFRLRVDVDYFCIGGCYPKIPLFCGSTPAFPVVCDPSAKGFVSKEKFVMDGLKIKRLTRGFDDSTRLDRANRDSIRGDRLLAMDTFDLHIPMSILCDAQFRNIVFQMAQRPYFVSSMGSIIDTIPYFHWLSDTLKFFDAESNSWSVCPNALEPTYFSTNTRNYYRQYVRRMDISQKLASCLSGSLTTPDSMVLVLRGVVQKELRNPYTTTVLNADLKYNQDGCGMTNKANVVFGLFSGVPNPGTGRVFQDYFNDPGFRGISPYLSVCGNYRMEVWLDNFYNVEKDPFPIEFRQPFIIEKIKVVVPPFFEVLRNQPNYARQYRLNRTFTGDTLSVPIRLRDSSGYTIIELDSLASAMDFEAVRHHLWFDLLPGCYDFIYDTIRVYKKFRYYTHHPDTAVHETIEQALSIPVNVSGVKPFLLENRKQLIRDTVANWPFSLQAHTANALPPKYFKHRFVWMLIDNKSGQIKIDSLVEYDTSGSVIHLPVIQDQRYLYYQFDTVYAPRAMQLFTRFYDCRYDSLVIYTGNSCDSFPRDILQDFGFCRDAVSREVLYYEPEGASIQIGIEIEPDSTAKSACDTFDYVLSVFNSGLGHSFENIFVARIPQGLDFISGFIEFPKGVFTPLGPPLAHSIPENITGISRMCSSPMAFPAFTRSMKITIRFI